MSRNHVTRYLLPILLVCVVAGMAGDSAQPDGPLDWTEGSWHGVRRDANDGTKAPITVLTEKMHDGQGQIERLEVATDGDPYVGFSVSSPNPAGNGWTRLYANDVRPKIARMVATSADGDRVVWLSLTATPPRSSRLVSERLGPDLWRRTQQVSTDNGATWSTLFVDELKREKPSGSTSPI